MGWLNLAFRVNLLERSISGTHVCLNSLYMVGTPALYSCGDRANILFIVHFTTVVLASVYLCYKNKTTSQNSNAGTGLREELSPARQNKTNIKKQNPSWKPRNIDLQLEFVENGNLMEIHILRTEFNSSFPSLITVNITLSFLSLSYHWKLSVT